MTTPSLFLCSWLRRCWLLLLLYAVLGHVGDTCVLATENVDAYALDDWPDGNDMEPTAPDVVALHGADDKCLFVNRRL